MHPRRAPFAPLRRLVFAGAAVFAVLMACGKDVTAPGAGPRLARNLSFAPVFPSVLSAAGNAAASIVPFTHVRVLLDHSDGTVALDTVVNFPAGADSITLSLTVPLLADAPSTGEPLTLDLDYVNAAGDTVFRGGPVTVNAVPGDHGTAPVQVPVTYSGPGATATSVHISPRTITVFEGDPFTFTAVAQDAAKNTIANTPIVWTSLGADATITQASGGSGTAGAARGSVRILAQLLTGPADTATLIVQPRASAIAALSGNAQSALVGATLPQPVVAHVSASDGGGVAGVAVTFAAANGGSVGAATVTTDSSGNAATSWTLGSGVGPQTLTASASGLSGSPVTFNATALAKPATQLSFATVPTSVGAGAPFTVTVNALDADGHVATGFTGAVTLALGASPAGAALSGTLSANAVAGVATFTSLSLNKIGTGYTLLASATGLSGATSGAIAVVVGAPASCSVVGGANQTAAAGTTLSLITVGVTDAVGDPVPNVTLSVSVLTGGGSVANSAPITNAAGAAAISWTLGPAAGAQSLIVSCPGSAAPFQINATAAAPLAGPATTLAFGVQPGNSTAGGSIAPSITVQAKDANGHPATAFTGNVTLAIGTNAGNGIIGGTTTVAAVAGVATFNGVTISTPGNGYTLTASSGELPMATSQPFSVGSPTANVNWTGATSTAWSSASNWNPNTVPGATDSVFIPPGGTQPTIAGAVSVKHLTVATGATVTNNGTLTVNGNLDAGNTIGGAAGVINLAGAAGNGTLRGTINGATVNVTATYKLAGSTTVTSAFNVNSSGQLMINGQTFSLTGNFATAGTGTLNMTNPADAMTVTGNVSFAGGSTAGLLTCGTLSVSGNYSATGSAFAASGTHFTQFNGVAQSITVVGVMTSSLQNVTFGGTSAVTIVDSLQMLGNVNVTPGASVTGGPALVGGTLADPGGGFRPSIAAFSGSTQPLSATTPVVNTAAAFGNSPTSTLLANLTVNGAVTVATGTFQLGGFHLTVNGSFTTKSGGTIAMTHATDSLIVTGNATFIGGATTGLLTAGNLVVGGNISVTGQSLDASGTHTTTLNSASFQTLTWTTPAGAHGYQNLIFRGAGGKGFSGDQYINGDVTIDATVNSVPVQGSYNVYIGGNIFDNSPIAAGGWGGSTSIIFSGTPTTIPSKLPVNTITFQGGAMVSLPNDVTTNYVVVNGAGTVLNLNGHTLKTNGNNFTTQNGGALAMMTAGDSLDAPGGSVYFNGGSTSGMLTAGAIVAAGVYQGYSGVGAPAAGTSPTAFAPSGSHRVWLVSGAGETMLFANPGTGAGGSHFNSLHDISSSTARLYSDIFVDDSLYLDSPSLNFSSDQPGTAGATRLITTQGLGDNPGTNAATFSNVSLKWVDGQPAPTYLQNIKWTSFPANFTGTVFEVNRTTSGVPLLGMHDFSWFVTPPDTLGPNGEFVKNSSPANGPTLNFTAPVGLSAFILAPGTHNP